MVSIRNPASPCTATAGTVKLSGSGTLGAPNVALTLSDRRHGRPQRHQSDDRDDHGNAATILNNGGADSVLTINGGGTTATVFKDGTTNKLGLTVGGGTLALSGASTYTGSTSVLAGTLQAGVATVGGATPTSGAFGKNSAVTLNGGATLDLKGFDETIGSLSDNSGSGGTVTSSVAGTPTLTVGGLNTDTSFAGIIQNGSATSVALTKIGSGTQTLSGVNTYTGPTTVTGGTLEIRGSLSGVVRTVDVTSGMLLLSGNNAINFASTTTTIGATGTLAQSGSSKSDLLGSLTLSSGATLDFGIGNTNTFTFASLDPATKDALAGGTLTLNITGWTGTPIARAKRAIMPMPRRIGCSSPTIRALRSAR